eukprot:897220-Pyramimonas_sp.AAC.1
MPGPGAQSPQQGFEVGAAGSGTLGSARGCIFSRSAAVGRERYAHVAIVAPLAQSSKGCPKVQ